MDEITNNRKSAIVILKATGKKEEVLLEIIFVNILLYLFGFNTILTLWRYLN